MERRDLMADRFSTRHWPRPSYHPWYALLCFKKRLSFHNHKVGLLMDKITYMTGSTNYIAPFLLCDVLLLGALTCVCFLDADIGLPKGSETMKEKLFFPYSYQ